MMMMMMRIVMLVDTHWWRWYWWWCEESVVYLVFFFCLFLIFFCLSTINRVNHHHHHHTGISIVCIWWVFDSLIFHQFFLLSLLYLIYDDVEHFHFSIDRSIDPLCSVKKGTRKKTMAIHTKKEKNFFFFHNIFSRFVTCMTKL